MKNLPQFILAVFVIFIATAQGSTADNPFPPPGTACPQVIQRADVQTVAARSLARMKLNIEHEIKGGNVAAEEVDSMFFGYLWPDIVAGIHVPAVGNEVWRTVSGKNSKLLYVCFPELQRLFSLRQQARQAQRDVRAREAEAAALESQKAEGENNRPHNVLLRSYGDYVSIRKCYDRRRGYLSVNITEAELERARIAVRSIEEQMLKADPTLDKDALWRTANERDVDSGDPDMLPDSYPDPEIAKLKQWQSDRARDKCRFALRDIEAVHTKLVPEAKIIRKDF